MSLSFSIFLNAFSISVDNALIKESLLSYNEIPILNSLSFSSNDIGRDFCTKSKANL